MLNSNVQWVEENIEGGGLEEREPPTLLLFIFWALATQLLLKWCPSLTTIISAVGMMLPFLKGWHFWWSVGVGNCTVLQLEDCNGLFFLNVRQTPSPPSPLFFFRIWHEDPTIRGPPIWEITSRFSPLFRVAIRSLSYKFRGPLHCPHFSATPFSCDWRQ